MWGGDAGVRGNGFAAAYCIHTIDSVSFARYYTSLPERSYGWGYAVDSASNEFLCQTRCDFHARQRRRRVMEAPQTHVR